MNQDYNYKFSEEERDLFGSIADHIRANSNDYKKAGKWLDEYCSESAYWLRREDELKELKEKGKCFSTLPLQQDIDHLENKIKEKRTLPLIIRFQEAQNYLLNNYGNEEFLSKKVVAKVIIITWLLTDPDAEKANLHITEFEKWKWEPLDSIFELNRNYAGFLFCQNKDPWMKLVHIAWDKITSSRQDVLSEDRKENKKFWQTSTFKFVLIPLITAVFLGIPSWFLLFSKPEHDSNINLNTSPEAKTSGDSSPAIITSGPNSSVTVNYDSPESKTKQIDEKQFFALTPKEILENIKSRPVFQQEDARKYYIGLKVKWRLYLFSVDKDKKDEKTAQVCVTTKELSGSLIFCSVEVSRYPQLKLAKRNAIILVSGEISEVDRGNNIFLSSASLEFE